MPKTPRRTPFRAFLSFWSRDVPPEALWVAPLALVWLIGLEAIAMGVILVALGFRLKRLRGEAPA